MGPHASEPGTVGGASTRPHGRGLNVLREFTRRVGQTAGS